MSRYITLLLAGSGLAAGQTCVDTQTPDTSCAGDDYKVVKDRVSLAECCADCAADAKCIAWSYEPGFIFSSVCKLQSVKVQPKPSSGDTCGQKAGPAPGPSPTPPGPAPGPAPPAPAGAAKHWAVIMAGSNTYGNYRHQADTFHAYQIAKKNGIPESQIILLAYDDVASSSQNPFPGKVFNSPTGPDVYAGAKISYKGKDVNKATFLAVLTGDAATAKGPVLKSTKDDKVFVFFADHGGVGILGVPDGAAGGYIHATEVNKALATMNTKGMYKELLFYVEACESGSIFTGLLTAPNVLAVTAANAKESSWGTFCPPMDMVQGKQINSCLGDTFSVNWMQNADASNFKTETLATQIAEVTKLTNRSHVLQFGDATIAKEFIGAFEGAEIPASDVSSTPVARLEGVEDSSVDTRDVEVHLAYYKMHRATSLEQSRAAQADLSALMTARVATDVKFVNIATKAVDGNSDRAQTMINGDFFLEGEKWEADCHFTALQIVTGNCGPLTDYSMRYSRLFANLCKVEGITLEKIEKSVKEVCTPKEDVALVV